jgi:hypothetical protein
MMKRIEQLEELQKNRESMDHWDPIHPEAARTSTAADAHPASRREVNFVSSQMETLQKILESNGTYGTPSLNSLCTIAA